MSGSRSILEAGRSRRRYWADLWRYRELLLFLAWRDVIVHYKQTVLGVAWALLRPLSAVAAFVVIFGLLAKLPSGGVPYPVMVLAGMLPWQMFASALTAASSSLLSNAGLVSKVYFPRLLMPLSAVVVTLLDFLVGLGALGLLMAWYGVPLTWRALTLPLFTLAALAAAVGGGVWLAALVVRYRDFRHLTPFVLQFGLLLSPVGFSSSLVPERYRLLYSLNPMVGVIDGFRWALLGGNAPFDPAGFGLSLGLIAALLASGLWYFRRTEQTFADVI